MSEVTVAASAGSSAQCEIDLSSDVESGELAQRKSANESTPETQLNESSKASGDICSAVTSSDVKSAGKKQLSLQACFSRLKTDHSGTNSNQNLLESFAKSGGDPSCSVDGSDSLEIGSVIKPCSVAESQAIHAVTQQPSQSLNQSRDSSVEIIDPPPESLITSSEDPSSSSLKATTAATTAKSKPSKVRIPIDGKWVDLAEQYRHTTMSLFNDSVLSIREDKAEELRRMKQSLFANEIQRLTSEDDPSLIEVLARLVCFDHRSLSELTSLIHSSLSNSQCSLTETSIRQWIQKAADRKVYGRKVKGSAVSMLDATGMPIWDDGVVESDHSGCSVMIWEARLTSHLPSDLQKTAQEVSKHLSCLTRALRPYDAFLLKYDSLSNKMVPSDSLSKHIDSVNDTLQKLMDKVTQSEAKRLEKEMKDQEKLRKAEEKRKKREEQKAKEERLEQERLEKKAEEQSEKERAKLEAERLEMEKKHKKLAKQQRFFSAFKMKQCSISPDECEDDHTHHNHHHNHNHNNENNDDDETMDDIMNHNEGGHYSSPVVLKVHGLTASPVRCMSNSKTASPSVKSLFNAFGLKNDRTEIMADLSVKRNVSDLMTVSELIDGTGVLSHHHDCTDIDGDCSMNVKSDDDEKGQPYSLCSFESIKQEHLQRFCQFKRKRLAHDPRLRSSVFAPRIALEMRVVRSEEGSCMMSDITDLRWFRIGYREFSKDNRPPFFGIILESTPRSIRFRNPWKRIEECESIHYDSDDSGVEWSDDENDAAEVLDDGISDAEDIGDDNDESDDADDQQTLDEDDCQFLINPDDPELGDRNLLDACERRGKSRGFPFTPRRKRGDKLDQPITVELPGSHYFSSLQFLDDEEDEDAEQPQVSLKEQPSQHGSVMDVDAGCSSVTTVSPIEQAYYDYIHRSVVTVELVTQQVSTMSMNQDGPLPHSGVVSSSLEQSSDNNSESNVNTIIVAPNKDAVTSQQSSDSSWVMLSEVQLRELPFSEAHRIYVEQREQKKKQGAEMAEKQRMKQKERKKEESRKKRERKEKKRKKKKREKRRMMQQMMMAESRNVLAVGAAGVGSADDASGVILGSMEEEKREEVGSNGDGMREERPSLEDAKEQSPHALSASEEGKQAMMKQPSPKQRTITDLFSSAKKKKRTLMDMQSEGDRAEMAGVTSERCGTDERDAVGSTTAVSDSNESSKRRRRIIPIVID